MATVLLCCTNIHLLNLALQRGAGWGVLPMYQAMSFLGQAVLGAAFFGELPASIAERYRVGLRVCLLAIAMLILAAQVPEEEAVCIAEPVEEEPLLRRVSLGDA